MFCPGITTSIASLWITYTFLAKSATYAVVRDGAISGSSWAPTFSGFKTEDSVRHVAYGKDQGGTMIPSLFLLFGWVPHVPLIGIHIFIFRNSLSISLSMRTGLFHVDFAAILGVSLYKG